jgi:hypothetical protein
LKFSQSVPTKLENGYLRSVFRSPFCLFTQPLIWWWKMGVQGYAFKSQGGRRWWGEGVRGWIWCKKCVHMYVNAKMIPVENPPGNIGEEG